jgi:hypothetical protein
MKQDSRCLQRTPAQESSKAGLSLQGEGIRIRNVLIVKKVWQGGSFLDPGIAFAL